MSANNMLLSLMLLTMAFAGNSKIAKLHILVLARDQEGFNNNVFPSFLNHLVLKNYEVCDNVYRECVGCICGRHKNTN